MALTHLYESEREANESGVIAARTINILWRVLSGRGQKQAFQDAGNFLSLTV